MKKIDLHKFSKRILVTGGAGFIGSNLCRYFVKKYPEYLIINFDAMTYASNRENFIDIESLPNYEFLLGDIRFTENNEKWCLRSAFKEFEVTDVIHLAAESHVDRSILDPNIFIDTNVCGTVNLLNVCKECWKDDYSAHRFHHVSTDEVYGDLDLNPLHKFTEETPYNPRSPYSASKASSDMFVRAYHNTYGLNTTISNCSNNYGPYQNPEKLIPLVVSNLMKGKDIPVYGTGKNVRDWLYVMDHVRAIDTIFHNAAPGETYNIGGNEEKSNIEIINKIIDCYCAKSGNEDSSQLINKIKYVTDRPGHDLRYAIDSSKLTHDLGWMPSEPFESGIKKTVEWFMENERWISFCKYKSEKWFEANYKNR